MFCFYISFIGLALDKAGAIDEEARRENGLLSLITDVIIIWRQSYKLNFVSDKKIFWKYIIFIYIKQQYFHYTISSNVPTGN